MKINVLDQRPARNPTRYTLEIRDNSTVADVVAETADGANMAPTVKDKNGVVLASNAVVNDGDTITIS